MNRSARPTFGKPTPVFVLLALLALPLTALAQTYETQHIKGDLILGNDNFNQKFIFHSRTNESGDFLQVTSDNSLGQWKWNQGLFLHRNGNVSLGTAASEHRLTVSGTIKARELNVTVEGWPDYVFADDYERPSLEELAAYITQYRHLPGIATAEEVAQHGVEVGAMQAQLLQKVEELTLYLIDLQQELDAVQAENEQLRHRLQTLEEAKQL